MHKYHTDGTHNTHKIITVILRFLTDSLGEAASSECSLARYLWWSWCIAGSRSCPFQNKLLGTSIWLYLVTIFVSQWVLIASFFNLCIAYFQKNHLQFLLCVHSFFVFLLCCRNSMWRKWLGFVWLFIYFVLFLTTLPLFKSLYFFFNSPPKKPNQRQEQNDT